MDLSGEMEVALMRRLRGLVTTWRGWLTLITVAVLSVLARQLLPPSVSTWVVIIVIFSGEGYLSISMRNDHDKENPAP
jgi:hypothetical protein